VWYLMICMKLMSTSSVAASRHPRAAIGWSPQTAPIP
jgi:hypothetical protein